MVHRHNLSLPPGYPAREASTYAAFRAALSGSGCDLCGLSAARNRIVVDRGDPSARVLAVGEAPGAEEDRTGRVFVGRAGRLLDAMLLEAGLDPARDLLIANVVKCRPPANRVPSREEARRCLPFLKRQIELARPSILVLLGATALRHLLPAEPAAGFTRRAGRFFRRDDYPDMEILILFHPAYVLRNPRRRPEMVSHLVRLRRKLSRAARDRNRLN